jgi:hypothetical protein
MDDQIPIPVEWAKQVCKILREGAPNKITWTGRAMREWQAATLSAFRYEPQEAMADALSVPGVTGHMVDLPEDGVTHAFFFPYQKRVFYGKICLRSNQVNIKIISAHVPRHGTEKLF